MKKVVLLSALLFLIQTPVEAGILHRVCKIMILPAKVTMSVIDFEYHDILATLYWSGQPWEKAWGY